MTAPELLKFHVSGGYRTLSCNLATFAMIVEAEDALAAIAKVSAIIKTDRRRRYDGSLDASAVQLKEIPDDRPCP